MLQPKWSQALIVNPFTLTVLRISGADGRTKVSIDVIRGAAAALYGVEQYYSAGLFHN